MKKRLLLFLLPILLALTPPTARAAGIRYDQIPSDVTGYFHLDIQALLSSKLMQTADNNKDLTNQLAPYLTDHADLTLYTPPSGPGGVVFLLRAAAPALRKAVQTNIARNPKSILITYDAQEIHFTPDAVQKLLLTTPSESVTTQPAKFSSQMSPENKKKNEASLAKSPAPSNDTTPATTRPPSRFSVGLGSNDPNIGKFIYSGPTYLAFVGDDLLLIAGDLPSISQAIDVLHRKSPSLATQDPQNLRLTPPPGTFCIGAGLSAEYSRDNTISPTTLPVSAQPAQPFGLDMFGSFKAKAQFAHFDLGEDDRQLFLDTNITMTDIDSATQLKNLIVGVKALIGLTHAETLPLLNPLELASTDKEVSLHWSWPNAKLLELLNLIKAQDNAGPPAKTKAEYVPAAPPAP